MREGSASRDRVRGRIIVREVLNHRTCYAALPNGKIIFAHLPKEQTMELLVGQELDVSLSLNDFSHGEILCPNT